MLDKLTSLVKEYAGDAIINNPAVPNEKNEEAVHLASNSIFDGLKNAVANGNLGAVKELFSSGGQNLADSPIVNNIKGGFVENLVQKLGIDGGKAAQIASSLIPTVLSKLIGKTNNANDGTFDLGSIIGALTSGGIGDMLGKFTGGGDKDSGGGALDKLKGLFN